MKNQSSGLTLATLTNASALVAVIFQKLSPDSLSREVAGAPLTVETICNTAQTIFEQKFKHVANLPNAYKG